MKTLTMRQPWASLVALGVKTIETRSWKTDHRGSLAIHAAKQAEGYNAAHKGWDAIRDGWECKPDSYDPMAWSMKVFLPLGAVVATCTLINCVPIAAEGELEQAPGLVAGWSERRQVSTLLSYDQIGPSDMLVDDHSGQLSFGDFTPGRWAWILDDIKPLDKPIPARGRQRLWNWEGPSA